MRWHWASNFPTIPQQPRSCCCASWPRHARKPASISRALQRVAADFDNYRKRVERDHTDNVTRASQRILEQMLPTLDSLDAALGYEPQTPAEEKILEGVSGTRTALLETLARDGFEPIPAVGEAFDPAVHEAVGGGGDGELRVGQELRRGYTLRGRVLRPSLVMVEEAN